MIADAAWMKPTMVVEVAFTEWTDGGHIRHPSFQGVRADKDAREVVRETATVPVPSPARRWRVRERAGNAHLRRRA